MSLLRTLCLLISSAVSAFSYSWEGHEIIADVAQELIKGTPAEGKVRELLGGYSMADVSTWADKIKGGNCPDPDLNAWRDVNRDTPDGQSSPRHNLHHYTNPAFQEMEYSADLKGTNPDDLIHAMRDCILILEGKEPSASFKGTSPRVALILLIHYAGDLAQPLHVGEGYLDENRVWVNPKDSPTAMGTAGGNRLMLGKVNLHYYWDKSFVSGAMRAAGFKYHPKEYAYYLASMSRWSESSIDKADSLPITFASTMLPKARKAYEGVRIRDFDGTNWTIQPSAQYNDMAVAMTGENLLSGGELLAEILVGIWP